MKKILLFFLITIVPLFSQQTEDQTIIIDKKQSTHQSYPLLVLLRENNVILEQIVKQLCEHFHRTARFNCILKTATADFSAQDIKEYIQQGYSIALTFNYNAREKIIEWRLYDMTQSLMMKGKRYKMSQGDHEILVRAIAHHIWTFLTNTPSSFLSKIIYCVKKQHKKGINTRFYLVDYDGSYPTLWHEFPTICINPRWSIHKKNPLITYSEFTVDKVRLKAKDFYGKVFMIFNEEGTTVGVSWNDEGTEMIYCRSGTIWHCAFNAAEKKWNHTCIIEEKEPCVAPAFLASGEILYGCGGKIKIYNPQTLQSRIVVATGYNVSPIYCRATKKIAYSKKVNGVMQLYLYDEKAKKHTQLTWDSGDKTDPTWSPCGTFIAFCYDKGKGSCIALLNVLNGTIQSITDTSQESNYPSWSPSFDYYLRIQ